MLDRLSDFQKQIVLACVFALTIVVTMYAYMASYDPMPLLEEFFVLDFLHSRSTSMMGFLTSTIDWNGPLPDDSWGLLASAVTAALTNLSNQSLTVLRTVSILLHAINCIVMFFVARDAIAPPEEERPALSTWLAAAASLIFALYPLAPEAVSFIGGLAYELGTAFFLTSFYLYLRGKRERNWTILGLSWISFLFAVLSDHSLWSSGFIMVALELSISFIGPAPPATGAKVPTEEQVFEDAVDRMLEDSKLHQEQTEKENHQESSDTASSVTPTPTGLEREQTPRVYDEDNDPDNLFETLVPCLPLIVLGVLLSIRGLPSTGNEQLPGDMVAGFSDWGRVFKHLFFPINEKLRSDNSNDFLQMWCIYAIPCAVSIAALIRNKQFRRNVAFLFAWLLVIIVPHLHTAISDSYLIGSRLAYSALVPASAMIALFLFSPAYALSGLSWANNLKTKTITMAITATLLAAILTLNYNRTVQQTIAYNTGAKRLEHLSLEVRKLADANKSPYVFLRDVPGDIGISNKVAPSNIIVFDSQKKLLRAASVPGGFLKDALRDGHYNNIIARWDSENQKLEKIDLQPSGENRIKLSAGQIYERAKSQVTDPESVQLDSSAAEVLIKSRSDTAPLIEFDAHDFSQLGEDFIYIECKVEMPKSVPDAKLHMYWSTSQKQDADKSRGASCAIHANDGQFHRYYIPLRSPAWTTNGRIDKIAFEFPTASRVVLKEIGTEQVSNRIAKLTYLKTEKRPDSQVTHTPVHLRLTYDYPDLPQLGLVTVDRKGEEATLKYDTSMVENAQGALVEISRADLHFAQSNPDREAETNLKTINLDNTIGEIKFPGKYFKTDGVYSVRVFATNKEGKLLGNASDEINCMIYSSPPGS